MSSSSDIICPQCQQNVSEERAQSAVIVCNHCGFTQNTLEGEMDKQHDNRFMKVVLIGAAIGLATFIHFVHWDVYSFSILPLKAKQWTGTASSEDLRLIAKICMERMRYSCAENALIGVTEKDATDLDSVFQLGELQRKTGKQDAAITTFQQYFSRGGNSAEAAYSLARLFETRGNTKDASDYYARALLAKPDVLQITVVQAYVAMLMKNGQSKEAAQLIEDVRKKNGPEGQSFMAKEYDQISK